MSYFTELIESARVDKPVTLSSGKQSNYYYDIKGLYLSGAATKLIDYMAASIRYRPGDLLCGVPTGGLLLASGLMAYRKKFKGIYIRDEVKTYGLEKKIEGRWEPGQNVIIIEDVVTTGRSVGAQVVGLHHNKLKVKAIYTVVDRSKGVACRLFNDLKIPYYSLYGDNT